MRYVLKYIFLFLGICVLSNKAFTQDPEVIDSLEKNIKTSWGNEHIDMLNKLAWEIKYSDIDRMKELTSRSLQYSRKFYYDKGLLLAYRNLTAYYYITGNLEKALNYSDTALNLANRLEDVFNRGKILNMKASILESFGEYDRSITIQKQALKIFRELKDTAEIAGNLHNLALAYEGINHNSKAFNLYIKALEMEKAHNNIMGIVRTSNHLGAMSLKTNDYENALKYYNITAEKAKLIGNTRWYSAAVHGIGDVYAGLDSIKKAEKYYKKAVEINKKNDYKDYLSSNYNNLGTFYCSLGNSEKGIRYLLKSVKLAKEINRLHYLNSLLNLTDEYINLNKIEKASKYNQIALNISDSLNNKNKISKASYYAYKIDKLKGDNSKALKHLENHINLKDSLYLKEQKSKLKELQIKYNFQKTEAENERLRAKNIEQKHKNEYQRLLFASSLVVIVLILVIAVILFINLKRKKKISEQLKKTNKQIVEKQKHLEETLATKDKIFSIIAHDLKNPFTSIIGLSDILSERLYENNNHELAKFSDGIYKASTDSFYLLNNLLMWSRSQRNAVTIKKEPLNLSQEVAAVAEGFTENLNEKNIDIEINISEELKVNADNNVLHLVFRNLISNAVKFTPENEKIQINTKNSDDKVIVSVEDNGIGMDEKTRENLFSLKNSNTTVTGTNNEKGSGLGLIIIKEFLDKHGNEIWVESEEGKGTSFYLTLDLPAEK